MKKKIFWFEVIFLVLHFFQLLADIQLKYFLPVSIIVLTSSHLIEKSKPYTPLFYVLVIFNTLAHLTFRNEIIVKVVEFLLIVAIGILMVLIQFFHISTQFKLFERLVKQKITRIGYRYFIQQNIPFSISYPTLEKSGKKVKWLPNKQYYKIVHQIFHIDPRQKQKMTQNQLKYATSFMSLYELPVQRDTKIIQKNKYKVIIFSHGLAAHLNSYSVFTNWWASRGFIVICIQHNHDQIMVDFRPFENDLEKVYAFLYEKRNKYLQIRANELKKIYYLLQEGYLDKIFQKHIQIQQIILAGHSYGGATILEAGAQLMDTAFYEKVNGYLCLDPWSFPLSQKTYKNLKKRILFVNSETFVRQNPQIYEMHKKTIRFFKQNPQMYKLKVVNMQHLHPTDMIYVFGTILKLFGIIKSFNKSLFFIEVTILLMYLFETGMKGEQILTTVNNELNKVLATKQICYLVKDERVNWKD